MKKNLFYFLLIILNIHSEIFAEPIFATIVFMKGKVNYIHNGETKSITRKTILEENDIIITEKGFLDIQIGPNSVFRINPGSKVKISGLAMTDNKQNINLNLEKGQLFSKVKNLPNGSKISVETPTLTGGVRGTEFAISGDSDQDLIDKKETLENGVYVTEGKVEVILKESSTKIEVPAGSEFVTSAKEQKARMLSDYNKEKMEILNHLKIMKESNFKLLEDQHKKNKSLMLKKKPWD